MIKYASVSLLALSLAACVSTPNADRQAQLYTFLDPSSGISYQLPGRCDLCRVRDSVATTEPPKRVAAAATADASLRKVSARADVARSGSVVVAAVTPVSDTTPLAVVDATPPPSHEVGETQAVPAAASDPAQALNLKIDTEFASAKRLISFGLGRGSLGPTGKLAVAELAPWAKRAEKVHLRGGADSSGNARRNRELAMTRASAVRSAFVAAGVDRKKMTTTFCTNCYVMSNETDGGRRINRRVEVEMVLKQELAAQLPKPVYALEPPQSAPLIAAATLQTPPH